MGNQPGRPAPPLCERCWRAIEPQGEFIRLGHLVDVRVDGTPVYLWAYLHVYDPVSGGCVGEAGAVAA